MGGGGGPSSLKFLPGVGLGGGVIFLIYFWRGGGSGQPGNPSGYTPRLSIRLLLSSTDGPFTEYTSSCMYLGMRRTFRKRQGLPTHSRFTARVHAA